MTYSTLRQFACTRDRTRTDKVVSPLEPETSASTNFATRVCARKDTPNNSFDNKKWRFFQVNRNILRNFDKNFNYQQK